MQANRWPRALAFLTWLLVGLSVAYWGLRLGEPAPDLGAGAPAAAPKAMVVDAAAVARALGGGPPQVAPGPALQKQLELVGVIAEGRRGVALLSVDGQPAVPFLVGARIDEGRVLQAVGHRRAEVADRATGQVIQRLEMPAQATPELPPGLKLVQGGRP